jgi:Tfp pilus assembly PilM family ATPase
MHPFVQNLLPVRANPIGVDFGTETLRLAQVERTDGEFRLIAAASAAVPPAARDSDTARFAFLKQTVRDLLAGGKFHGRRAILSLPASRMFIQHLRLPPDGASRQGALHGSLKLQLKTTRSEILLRHLVAGQTEQDGRKLDEVIAMGAEGAFVDDLLHAAALAKLDVIAMNVEPIALVDCFSHVYRRRVDAGVTSLYIDIGSASTRVIAACGSGMLFARCLGTAGNALNDAVAATLQTSRDAARVLRIQRQLSLAPKTPEARGRIESVQTPAAAAPIAEPDGKHLELHRRIDGACEGSIKLLIADIRQCVRDHEQSFPDRRIDRLIFVGGESRDSLLCARFAAELKLPAQIGDPLVRMGRISSIAADTGIDRREPQPAWAVAIGLSMGPAAAAVEMAVDKVS